MVGNQNIELEPGQFITGRNDLSDDFNYGVKKSKKISGLTLFRWLESFEKLEMLNIKTTNKYTIVTVNNWCKYQGNEQQLNSKRTSTEHQPNNTCTTNEQQLNTYKNDKNVKNVKNEKKEKKEDICYQQIADMYNNTCVSFPRLTKLSDARKKAIKARLKTYTADDLQNAFKLAEQSDFLKGANNRNWSATFDWMLKDTNLAKILDGNYTNNSSKTSSTEKQLPAWWDNQDLIKVDPEFDEEEFDRKIEELRNSL